MKEIFSKRLFSKSIIMETKHRNINFELLRIVSMLFIVVIHSFGHGKVDSINFATNIPLMLSVETIKYICYVGVNCFILISSYFLIDSQFKLGKLIHIWLQTFFWSVFLCIILNWNGFQYKQIIKSLLPISFNQYWYISQYFALYILSPFLSHFAKSMTKKQYVLFLSIILSFSVIWRNVYLINATTSLDWFLVLFFVGGYLNRFFTRKYNWGILFIVSIFLWVFTYNLKILSTVVLFHKTFAYGTWNVNYNSIPILISSILLFLYFRNMKINNEIISKITLTLSPLMLGVYLIHDNMYIREILWKKLNLSLIDNTNSYLYKWIISFLLIFIFCICLEYCRKIVFKYTYIDYVMNTISNKITDRLKI